MGEAEQKTITTEEVKKQHKLPQWLKWGLPVLAVIMIVGIGSWLMWHYYHKSRIQKQIDALNVQIAKTPNLQLKAIDYTEISQTCILAKDIPCALRANLKADKLTPNNASILIMIGDDEALSHNKTLARSYYARAREISSHGPERDASDPLMRSIDNKLRSLGN